MTAKTGPGPKGVGHSCDGTVRLAAERCATIAKIHERPRDCGGAVMGLMMVALHLPLHFHRFHGPPFDYLGLAVAAALSWIVGVGPGEPLLIAAAVLAAKHKLDLTEVLLVAWVGAFIGGVIGWLIGLKAGRAILTARGPFRKARQNALARGERIFERRAVPAVILTPSWVSGIHGVRWSVYLPANALSAAMWAVGIGVGGFLIGPPVAELFGDLGTVGLIILCAAVAAGGVAEAARRRRIRPG